MASKQISLFLLPTMQSFNQQPACAFAGSIKKAMFVTAGHDVT